MNNFLFIHFADFLFCSRLLQYIGRDCAPSPATGSKAAHKKELNAFLDKAMEL